jgi:dihydroorotase
MDHSEAPLDLIGAGGHVLDPGQGIDGPAEVGIRDGRVAAVTKPGELPRRTATTELDAGGRLVTPGLIDLHTHVFDGISILGIDADTTCLPTGVTTVVDAGTAGEIGFERFRRGWIDPSATRILAFVNLSSLGLVVDDGLELGDRELRYVNVERIVETVERHRDVCLGIKVRVATNQMAPPRGHLPLNLALEAAARASTRLMVHITEPGIPLDDVFDRLRPGDIVTHLFHGRKQTVVGDDGHVLASLRRARERGVTMDIGHGGGSFTFKTARAALADGFEPDTLSTDLHTISIVGACKDLPTTMGKFVALGMSVQGVVAATTINAARAIGRPDVAGTLAPGTLADLAIFDEVAGRTTYEDVNGERIDGDWALQPWRTVRAGRVIPAGSLQLG